MTYNQAKSRPGVNLVEFYASWCPHCQRMSPILKEVKKQIGTSASIFQYDIDRYPFEADNAGAYSVPTYIIYNNGKEVWRQIGELNSDDLVDAIEAAREMKTAKVKG